MNTPPSKNEYPSLTNQTAALAGSAYAVLILIIWGAFGPHSGLPYETSFPYTSETSSVLGGFLYRADPMRIHTSTFYHLAYVISEAFGVRGSYVPFQVVYALLWWARGFLIFLILRKFLPRCITVCYVAGALVVMHASDSALEWVGQMNQFGFMFWMLLAFYLFILGVESTNRALATLWIAGACFCQYMSLWSYESQVLIMLMLPLLLLLRWRGWRRLAVGYGAWYSVLAVYIGLSLLKYTDPTVANYQSTVLRKRADLPTLLSDLYFNIAASLEFWNWPQSSWKAPKNEAYLLSAIAVLVFIGCGIGFVYLIREGSRPKPFVDGAGTWRTLLGVGFVLVALSFPVYLLLDSARSLWRTQFLSGIGAGLVLTAVAGLVSRAVVQRTAIIALFLAIGGVITFYGSASAIQKGANHRWIWERQRAMVKEILRVAPSVRPNTVVVLLNVPKDNDPFGHIMWMDMALRLMYPGIPVAGVYFYADGTPCPGDNLTAEGNSWKWDETGLPGIVTAASLSNTLVVEYEPSGPGKVEAALPDFVCKTRCQTALYHPGSMITGPISPIAIRRYRVN